MLTRRDTLDRALDEIEAGTLPGATTIVVSRSWWDALSGREQGSYRTRAGQCAVALHADRDLSAHFVEVRDDGEGPSLSTERLV